MTQMISDGVVSNQSSSRNFQRLAVPNYILEREIPEELQFFDSTPQNKLCLKRNQKQIVPIMLKPW